MLQTLVRNILTGLSIIKICLVTFFLMKKCRYITCSMIDWLSSFNQFSLIDWLINYIIGTEVITGSSWLIDWLSSLDWSYNWFLIYYNKFSLLYWLIHWWLIDWFIDFPGGTGVTTCYLFLIGWLIYRRDCGITDTPWIIDWMIMKVEWGYNRFSTLLIDWLIYRRDWGYHWFSLIS